MPVTEIVPGIHRIECPLGERVFCAFVLTGSRMTILIDTGVASTPAQTLLAALDELGVEPDLVLITHADFDHHGGNVPIAEAFPHARFACHAADRAQIEDPELLIAERYGEFAPRYGIAPDPDGDADVRAQTTAVPIDLTLAGGETLRLADDHVVEVIHAPGHSRGHLIVHDPRSATTIVADAVLGDTLRTAAGEPAFPPTYRYVDAYRQTTTLVRALGAQRLLTSHFPVIEGREQVDAFLDLTSSFTDAVERALLAALADRPMTLAELIAETAPRLGPWTPEASAFLAHPLAGHLERQLELSGVAREGERFELTGAATAVAASSSICPTI